ncbi:MAG: hypothetical protein Q4F49_05855 [Pseudoxanthomonas suwonensis]|nr:hypothetical protein [Pseudoxanthomonas suwonensis]
MTRNPHRARLARTFGRASRSLLLILCWSLANPATAQRHAASLPPADPTEDPARLSAGFLSSHPDLRFRLLGIQKWQQGEKREALDYFMRAAYYADKPSQAMVAEMYWEGDGVPRDRSLAYVWMDLAAERGYRGFVGLREQYWSRMDIRDRNAALAHGETVFGRYADDVAQPRIDRALRRGLRNQTGSRTGFTGALKIVVPGPGGFPEEIDASKYYDSQFWNPAQYRAWHDAVWKDPPVGKVVIGDFENVIQATTPSTPVPTAEPESEHEPDVPPR